MQKTILKFQRQLELAVTETTKGQFLIHHLMKKKNAHALYLCADFYYNVSIFDFKKAIWELTIGKLESARHYAEDGSHQPTTCERELTEAHIINNDISYINFKIEFLSFIARVAISNL